MSLAKPVTTPMVAGLQMSKHIGITLQNPHQYRSIVGALQYTTVIRPDLTFVVNKTSQFMVDPSDDHWQMVKRILLKGY
jgi:hypothetical protein